RGPSRQERVIGVIRALEPRQHRAERRTERGRQRRVVRNGAQHVEHEERLAVDEHGADATDGVLADELERARRIDAESRAEPRRHAEWLLRE
ncbi:MAG: hypothetical protein ACK55I_46725, partial [bacterium]